MWYVCETMLKNGENMWFVRGLLLASAPALCVWLAAGCAAGDTEFSSTTDSTSTTTGMGGSGGSGGSSTTSGMGGNTGPCGTDCSLINTPQCQVAQCNVQTGQCEVVNDEQGVACDDGMFCTISDSCSMGTCVGGPQNDCGMAPPQCTEVTCDEMSQTCSSAPSMNGAACQDANDLCLKGATCNNGLCIGGVTDDCFFFPVPDDCHVAECNSTNGMCEPVVGNEGGPCNDINTLCTVNKTCAAGICQGGDPKDCSFLTIDCNLGVCDTITGQCGTMSVMNGQPCDDLDPCTTGETCSNMMCSNGSPVTVCQAGDFCCPMNCDENNDLDCASCDWNTNLFPISWSSTNSVGDMTFDSNCNLYWSADGGELFKLNYNSNQVQTLHDFGTLARGVVFNPNDNFIYVATNTGIHRITTTGQSPTALPGTNIGTYFNGMTVAPGGWGAYGGHLIVARNNGSIYAVNPAGGAPVVIGTRTGTATDAEFDYQTGTLYVSYYLSNGVFTLSPGGQFTQFATGLSCSVDGIAIEEGLRLFAACGSNDTLHKLTMPGGAATLIGSSTLSGGWAPAGLIFDGLDNLIVMEDGEFLQIYTP
jgi:hypothetical protein